MLIDMHNHSNIYSSCSIISPDNLINKYIDAKIDGICLTEHNILWDKVKQDEMQKKYRDKIKMFFGIEVNTDIGHVLVFGNSDTRYPELTKFNDLIKLKSSETAIIWAHPLRWGNFDINEIPENIITSFDAIELYNGNVDENKIKATYKFFKRYNMKFTGGSDTHSESMACKYVTNFHNDITSIEELVKSIKIGDYKPEIVKV